MVGGPDGAWFATRELGPGVHLIAEPFLVNSFLVEGSDTRVHIDTGLDIADIRAAGDALASNRAWAANTHHHFDHVGGNHLFEEIAIHELGVGPLAGGTDRRILEEYRAWVRAMADAWPVYRDLDGDYFDMLDEVSTLRPWPAGFDLDAWTIRPTEATRTLTEGDVLDLGGRALRVLHTPGHTPDSVCFLDEVNGLLFSGDTVNSGPILVNDPQADLEAFARSTRRLAEDLSGSVRDIYMAHGSRFRAEPGYLRELADGFEAVADGSVTPVRVHDTFSGWSLLARFPRFSIVLPDKDAKAQ